MNTYFFHLLERRVQGYPNFGTLNQNQKITKKKLTLFGSKKDYFKIEDYVQMMRFFLVMLYYISFKVLFFVGEELAETWSQTATKYFACGALFNVKITTFQIVAFDSAANWFIVDTMERSFFLTIAV